VQILANLLFILVLFAYLYVGSVVKMDVGLFKPIDISEIFPQLVAAIA
jgi:hypothetical protein